MFQRNMALPAHKVILSLSAVLMLTAGCASKKPPMVGGTGYQSPCPPDLTQTCFEYLGKKQSCRCASRDAMEEVLEPTRQ
jgi:hypothetical protein